jgi:hypothetical protein
MIELFRGPLPVAGAFRVQASNQVLHLNRFRGQRTARTLSSLWRKSKNTACVGARLSKINYLPSRDRKGTVFCDRLLPVVSSISQPCAASP